MIEDQVANYDIDGVMWCNERYSPLDQLFQGNAPGDFSEDFLIEAKTHNLNIEKIRASLLTLYEFFQESFKWKKIC